MTFILNVLHKDFTLLCSDRKATVEGPTKITMPGITIHAEKGATIHGYKKIVHTKDNSVAIGFAGTTKDHYYLSDIEESQSPDQALTVIRQHMEGFLKTENREEVLTLESFMENQGIGTFYDSEQQAYFSNIYLFSPIHNYTRMYTRTIEGARLIHVGSGSNEFENAVGLDEINAFASSVLSLDDITEYLSWIKNAYKKVSEHDEGTGEEVSAVVSTRTNPVFVET